MNKIALAFLAASLLPSTAAALVFDVTKTADTWDTACDADCSLREAVAAANANPGEDAILLGPGVYILTREGAFEDSGLTGDLDYTERLVILGAGAGETILDGAGLDRVFDGQTTAEIELHDLTVRNGRARSRTSNSGHGNGGAISGSAVLVGCVLTGNRAENGGAVEAIRLTARDTTITDNTADFDGGGIAYALELDLRNVTVSGNHAGDEGGGLLLLSGDNTLDQVTVTGNGAARGGGIAFESLSCPDSCPETPFVLARSVVAGNKAALLPDCDGLPFPSAGWNVLGVPDGCNASATDRAGTAQNPLDPKLSPLGDHGGPTPTHLPLAGSPVLDFAQGCSATDQRGAPRPASGCDAGAVEVSRTCVPGDTDLCLQGGRFRATATWKTATAQGAARAVPLTPDTGAFWFFSPTNLELTLKVLDGCAVNERFWVFVTGLTDVEVEIRVEDTEAGITSIYHSPGKAPFEPRLNTNAFVCP
ncbi:MAG: CSLREA domain-containing protein [Acidobacteriota bacterium]